MDLKALQARLRDFAAARDWQPYHSPKNLAMALMVEAAELLELFQWLTTEQSNTLTRDAADKERVGDEIADVLLYLLQLADHTGVDVEQSVERKLRKNAEKHPAKHPEKPLLGPRGHLLVDWENVQPKGEELRALVPEGTDVWLFHGPQQKVEKSSHFLAFGSSRVTFVPRTGAGRNALDFQLSYYIGYISARQPQERFVVVSNDTGYDPMLEHARELGFDARRYEFRRPPQPAVAPPAKHKAKAPAQPQPAPQPLLPAIALPPIDPSAAQIAWRAIVRLRELPADGLPVNLEAFMESLIGESGLDKSELAQRASQLLRGRRLGLVGATDTAPPVNAVPTLVVQPAPQPALPVLASVKKRPVVKPAETSVKATRQEVQQLAQLLNGMASTKRPVNKDVLLALLQNHLGETSVQSLRVTHALAQLRAQKRVVLKGNVVSYPSLLAAKTAQASYVQKKAALSPLAKKATAVAKLPRPKVAQKPVAAQVAQAVLASLKKMPKNKPTRRAGLLKFIETHTAKAVDPKAMAQQVCTLLEARNDVALSQDGTSILYPKLSIKKASSA